MTEVCEAERNWRGKSDWSIWLVNNQTDWSTIDWRTRQTGFCGFDHAITGAIFFTFHNGKRSSFDRPNYTSIQIFHFNNSTTLAKLRIGTPLQPIYTSRKLGDAHSVKEQKPSLINQHSVVYKFSCPLCDAEYIGLTTRHLFQRIEEHCRSSSSICRHLQQDHDTRGSPILFPWPVNGHFCFAWSVNKDLFFRDLWIYIFPSSGNWFSFFSWSVKYTLTYAWFVNQRLLRE